MSTPILGICISAAFVALFLLLFQYEYSRGVRFFPGIRSSLDRGVDRIAALGAHLSTYVGREMPRQTVHYFFHTVLTKILGFLEHSELSVRKALRTNRSLSRNVSQDKRVKNKLDEIAEHKESVALTDDEKRKHREKMLEG